MPLPSFDPRLALLFLTQPEKPSLGSLIFGKRTNRNAAAYKFLSEVMSLSRRSNKLPGARALGSFHQTLVGAFSIPPKEAFRLDPRNITIGNVEGPVSGWKELCATCESVRHCLPRTFDAIIELDELRIKVNSSEPVRHTLSELPYFSSPQVQTLSELAQDDAAGSKEAAIAGALLGLKAINYLIACLQTDLSKAAKENLKWEEFLGAGYKEGSETPLAVWLHRVAAASPHTGKSWLKSTLFQIEGGADSAKTLAHNYQSGKTLMPYAKAWKLIDDMSATEVWKDFRKLEYVLVVYAHNLKRVSGDAVEHSDLRSSVLSQADGMFADYGLMLEVAAEP